MQNKIIKFFLGINLFKRIIPSIIRKIHFFKKSHIVQLKNFKLNLSLNNSIERKIFLENSLVARAWEKIF